MDTLLTVFIPAYNEGASLGHCVAAVRERFTALGVRTEILIVDDGSSDGTASLADALAAAHADVRVVHHRRNGGIGRAFATAAREARGEWMILIPADLALEPSDLEQYVRAAPDADVVVGLRSDRSDYTLARKLVSLVNIRMVQTLFGTSIRQFQYISMYRMTVLRSMEIEYTDSAFFLAEVIVKAGALGKRLREVEIHYAPRVSGQATGAKARLIASTMRDMLRFWAKWVRLGSEAASRKSRH